MVYYKHIIIPRDQLSAKIAELQAYTSPKTQKKLGHISVYFATSRQGQQRGLAEDKVLIIAH